MSDAPTNCTRVDFGVVPEGWCSNNYVSMRGLVACSVCGVAVVDAPKHLDWHDKISPEDAPHIDVRPYRRAEERRQAEERYALAEKHWSTVMGGGGHP